MSMLYIYVSTAVQVVTESFPISSSGHCALLDRFWSKFVQAIVSLQPPVPWSDRVFFERFIDLLHLIPLCIIAIYFYKRWSLFVAHPIRTWRLAVRLIGYAALADVVTGAFYLVRDWSFFTALPLWLGFGLTTIFLFSLLVLPEENSRLTSVRAIGLGLFQGAALLVPGLSRFATTFFGARLLGFSSRQSLEVSFMIQWPLMLAAATRSVFFFAHTSYEAFMVPMLWIVVAYSAVAAWYGFVFSARTALLGRLWVFGFYTALVALGSALLAY